jgi:hypothetical protein
MPHSYNASISGPASDADGISTIGILVAFDNHFFKFTGDGDSIAQFPLAYRAGVTRMIDAALSEFDASTSGQINFSYSASYPGDNNNSIGITLTRVGSGAAVAALTSNGVNFGSVDLGHLRNCAALLSAAPTS